jgi:hypothetical protein
MTVKVFLVLHIKQIAPDFILNLCGYIFVNHKLFDGVELFSKINEELHNIKESKAAILNHDHKLLQNQRNTNC